MNNKNKVFCLGLWKTGTKSIGSTISALGYKVKISPWSLFDTSDMAFEKFHNPQTWEPYRRQIEEQMDIYDGFSDTPWHFIYDMAYKKYPNAKFILTTRVSPQAYAMSEYFHSIGHARNKKASVTNILAEDDFVKRYEYHNNKIREYFKDNPNFMECQIETVSPDSIERFLGEPVGALKKIEHSNKRSSGIALYEQPVKKGLGLFAYFLRVVSLMAIGEDVYVNLNKNSVYYDPEHGDNEWEYYFEQPCRYPHLKHNKEYVQFISEFTHVKCLNLLNNKGYGNDIPVISYQNGRDCTKAIKIKSHIIKKADDFYNRHMKGFRVIGVQKRGTDAFAGGHANGQKFENESIYKRLDELIVKYDKIFLMTDEWATCREFEKRYGRKIIYYLSLRSDNNHAPIHKGQYNKYSYLIGEEVVIEAMILSKVDYLLAMHSNISLFAIWKGDLAFEFTDNHITYQ